MNLNLLQIGEIVERALAEDIGTGDITTSATISPASTSKAHIISRESGVLAGLPVAMLVFSKVAESYGCVHCTDPSKRHIDVSNLVTEYETFKVSAKQGQPTKVQRLKAADKEATDQPRLNFFACLADGCTIEKGEKIVEIFGPTDVILTAERTALNFLQRMSGIASATSKLVNLVKHTNAKIIDTRKTAPGLRILDKYAVRCGGGQNHRFGLYDAILIKDNHIQAAGSISEAIKRAKNAAPHTIKIEVETDTIEQVEEALAASADMILLDNMRPTLLRECVKLCRGHALTEASGGITLKTIVEVAETGVDLISVGALTHSVNALDLSLEILG